MDVILTSKGLDTNDGQKLIKKAVISAVKSGKISEYSIGLISQKKHMIDEILIQSALRIGFGSAISISSMGDMKNITYPIDFWYISGGNTFELMDFIRKTGLDKIIKSTHTKVVIGSSAGAVILSSSIFIASEFDENTVGMTDMCGLNLIPCWGEKPTTIIPHYTNQELKRWKRHTEKEVLDEFEIINVSNNQFLLIDSGYPQYIYRGRI